jgi:hypothetical protein
MQREYINETTDELKSKSPKSEGIPTNQRKVDSRISVNSEKKESTTTKVSVEKALSTDNNLSTGATPESSSKQTENPPKLEDVILLEATASTPVTISITSESTTKPSTKPPLVQSKPSTFSLQPPTERRRKKITRSAISGPLPETFIHLSGQNTSISTARPISVSCHNLVQAANTDEPEQGSNLRRGKTLLGIKMASDTVQRWGSQLIRKFSRRGTAANPQIRRDKRRTPLPSVSEESTSDSILVKHQQTRKEKYSKFSSTI